MRPSRAGNSHASGPICPKVKLVQDFMTVFITCMFDEDPIKNGPSRAGNSHANCQNWAKIKLVSDFMSTVVICKFEEDLIKKEVTNVGTTFSPLYIFGRLKGK